MKKNRENILCLFPEDDSLLFLSPLRAYLEKNYRCHIIYPNEESYYETIRLISTMHDNTLVLFVGHGASHCFYGGCNKAFPRKQLINSSNINILNNKNVFALSCRSNEFFDLNKANLNNFFGFGNLPTDWNEIITERDIGDPFYLKNINEEEIQKFKSIVNDVILSVFQDTDDYFDFKTLYLGIKLLLNKEISELITTKTIANYRELANLIFYMKQDILYRFNN